MAKPKEKHRGEVHIFESMYTSSCKFSCKIKGKGNKQKPRMMVVRSSTLTEVQKANITNNKSGGYMSKKQRYKKDSR